MKLYHKAHKNSLASILENGLAQGSEGNIGGGTPIHQAGLLLNAARPNWAIKAGLNRITNTYCYLEINNLVYDIDTGKKHPLSFFLQNRSHAMLHIEADLNACYDLFDRIMAHLAAGDVKQAEQLAPLYWSTVTPLSEYADSFGRPEAIVTYGIEPKHITHIE